jgi:hypothetical protein
LVLLVLLLAGSLLVDANGRFPAMSESQSKIVTVSLFISGLVSSIAVIWFDHSRRRLWAVLIALFFVIFCLPAAF